MKASRTITPFRAALFAAVFALGSVGANYAEARRKGRRGKKAAPVAKVNVRAIGELMGEFSFGMSKDEVLKVLEGQIDARFAAELKGTTDVYKQDSLRREKRKELAKIKKTYKEFTGKKTGWDVSIIDDQFGHKTDESMLVFWENNSSGSDQRRFFFFHQGQLFKMFIALDSAMLPVDQRSFDYFKSLMVKRYGDGKVVTKTKRSGAEIPVSVDWRTSKFHVQALDKLSFYGSFCLVIGDPNVEATVLAARDANRSEQKGNAVIDSMLKGDDASAPSLDSNKAAVDAIIKGR